MRLNFITWFCVFTLFFSLAACEDHRMPTNPRFRIKTVTKQSTQELSIDTYSYDSQGKLASINKTYSDRRLTSNREYAYKTVFHYESMGKLKSVEYQPDDTALSTIIPSRYDYEYDANENAVVIKYTQTSPDVVTNQFSKVTFSLEYNGSKLPVKITAVSDVFMDGSITDYLYEQGNVVRIKKGFFDNTGGIKTSYTRTYQFDDRPNPFRGLYIGAPDPDLLSDFTFKLNTFYQSNTFNQNNFIDPNLNYEYDTVGNLVKISGSPTTTLDYEPY